MLCGGVVGERCLESYCCFIRGSCSELECCVAVLLVRRAWRAIVASSEGLALSLGIFKQSVVHTLAVKSDDGGTYVEHGMALSACGVRHNVTLHIHGWMRSESYGCFIC